MDGKCYSCKLIKICVIKEKVDAMDNSFCGRTEGVVIGVIGCPYHKEDGDV